MNKWKLDSADFLKVLETKASSCFVIHHQTHFLFHYCSSLHPNRAFSSTTELNYTLSVLFYLFWLFTRPLRPVVVERLFFNDLLCVNNSSTSPITAQANYVEKKKKTFSFWRKNTYILKKKYLHFEEKNIYILKKKFESSGPAYISLIIACPIGCFKFTSNTIHFCNLVL